MRFSLINLLKLIQIKVWSFVEHIDDLRDGDALDQIELTLSAENRSRRQIGNKLKELGLISKMEEVTRKPLKSGRGWQEEEESKLRELVEEWKSSDNPGARIHEQWKAASMPVRSKKALVEKAVEMELVSNYSFVIIAVVEDVSSFPIVLNCS